MTEIESRPSLVPILTTTGLLAYTAWLLFFFRQIERAVRVSSQPFAGVWSQRIEVLSFVVFPPNVLILVPAAALASAATWMAGPRQTLDLAILLRIVRWSANVLAAIAVAGVVDTIVSDSGSPTRAGDVALRLSGLLFAVAISRMCKAVGRTAPGG